MLQIQDLLNQVGEPSEKGLPTHLMIMGASMHVMRSTLTGHSADIRAFSHIEAKAHAQLLVRQSLQLANIAKLDGEQIGAIAEALRTWKKLEHFQGNHGSMYVEKLATAMCGVSYVAAKHMDGADWSHDFRMWVVMTIVNAISLAESTEVSREDFLAGLENTEAIAA